MDEADRYERDDLVHLIAVCLRIEARFWWI